MGVIEEYKDRQKVSIKVQHLFEKRDIIGIF